MVKLIESSQFSDVPEIGAKMAEFSSPAMAKEAENIFGRSYDSLKPEDDRFVGIHLVALGDEEHFGPNRNFDSMPKESCIRDHATFVQHGHVFSHHHNDAEKDEILGSIKASAYNEKMGRIELFIWADREKAKEGLDQLEKDGAASFSMATRVPWDECFTKGTLVRTVNGYTRIDEIRPGDLVVSTKLGVCPVLATSVKPARELTRLSVSGLPLDIECTPNHPFFTVRACKIISCHGSVCGKKRRHTFNKTTVCTSCHRSVDVGAEWVPAGDLHTGDYLKIAVDRNSACDTVGTSFAYLAGQYVGDGSLIIERRGHNNDGDRHIAGISISASAAEADAGILNRLSKAFTRVTGKEVNRVNESCGKKAYKVNMHDQLFAHRICTLFGAGSRTKFISHEVTCWSENEKIAFLCGLIDSDGCVTESKHTARVITVNRGLALSIQRICWSLGLRATCYVAQKESALRSEVFCTSGPAYGVQFSEFVGKMFSLSDKISRFESLRGARTHGSTVLLAGGYAYLRVTDSYTFKSDGVAVYNLEVAKDHTYNAEGADVHNCSICGAHRKNSSDPNMCDHIRHQLGKIAENGKVAFMRNKINDWFDISFVTRPADRIAYSLKVADAQADGVVTSEMLAKAAGISAPSYLDPGLEADKRATLRKLADAYDRHARGTPETGACRMVVDAAHSRLDDATIDTLRRMPVKQAAAFLADSFTFMGPDDFCRYAMGPKSAEYAEVGPHADQVGAVAREIIKESAWLDRFDLTSAGDFDFDRFTERPSRRFSDVASASIAVKSASLHEDNYLDLIAEGRTETVKTAGARIDTSTGMWFNTVDKPILATALKYAEYKVAALNAVLSGEALTCASNTENRDTLLALVAAQDL